MWVVDSRCRRVPGDMRCDLPLAGFLAASLLSALLWALAYLLWCAVGA